MRHAHYSCGTRFAAGYGTGLRQPKILTIDDDPNVSQALKRRFNQYRVTVLQAQHGMHGIWLATTRDPDVIITDLRMPQGRGQDVVAFLGRDPHTRDIPVIVLTGVFDEELRGRMMNLGVEAYFCKPVDFEELREAVERYIDLEEKEEEEPVSRRPNRGALGEPWQPEVLVPC